MPQLKVRKRIIDSLLASVREVKKRPRAVEEPEIPTPRSTRRATEAAEKAAKKAEDRCTKLTTQGLARIPRLNGAFHPICNVLEKKNCQWCHFRKHTLKEDGVGRHNAHIKCTTCGVVFCNADCFTDFHTRAV